MVCANNEPRRPFRRQIFRYLGLIALLMAGIGLQEGQAQIFRLPSPDTTAGNFFGHAAALDGNRALIGASGEHGCGPNSGRAYVYERSPETGAWTEAARLTPEDCTVGAFFGRSVALSGNRALVAASGALYSRDTNNAAYIFERDSSGTWHEVAELRVDPPVPEGIFATSVALDGDRALITSSGDVLDGHYNGAAYIFERNPTSGAWEQAARLTGSGSPAEGVFGGSAALDGDYAVVSASTYFAHKPGSIYIFERDTTSGRWHEAAHFGGIDDFFISVDIDGRHVITGESKASPRGSGVATLYSRDDGGAWHHSATIRPRTPYQHGAFGTSVSLRQGAALIVGYDEQLGFDVNIDRVVYVFHQNPQTASWEQTRVIDIGEVAFGSAVDLDSPFALIGNASEQKSGTAYVVRID